MESEINIVELPKYFKIYNSVSQDLQFDNPFVEVKNKQELLEFIRKHWGVNQNQVRFEYNENIELDECYVVKLTNKVGETFAWIGDINFNHITKYNYGKD